METNNTEIEELPDKPMNQRGKNRRRSEKYYYKEEKSDPTELLKNIKPKTPPYIFYVHPENRKKE